jgi:hypothetical protein
MAIFRPRSIPVARALARGAIALLFVLQALALLPGESHARSPAGAAAVASGEICRPSPSAGDPAHDALDHGGRDCALCPIRCDAATPGAALLSAALVLPARLDEPVSGPPPFTSADRRPARRIVSWSSRAPPLG